MNRRTHVFSLTPRTWLGRFVALIIGLALLVTAAFVATIALVVGALIAAFLIARVYWLLRKAEKQRAREFLNAEYTVEPEETARLKGRAADRRGRDDL